MISFLALLVLVSAVPVGLLVSWLARDELRAGRTWFMRVSVVASITGITCLFYGLTSAGLSLWYLAIIAFVSYARA